MQLTFGIYLDGASWSERPASLGELKLGPYGLLHLLETRTGLTCPTFHPAERINQYMQRLKECDGADKWFQDSFAADSWSTARQMLVWRDELIEAGWRGEADNASSARLRALAELEQSDLPLAAGLEDRLQLALQQLEQMSSIAISHIRLHEHLGLLPPVWQKVLSRLRNIGVNIEDAAEALQHAQRSSNLLSIQATLAGNTTGSDISENDDSLLMVNAADEWEAAENLAFWLAADTAANRDVTIICGADTDVLDQALRRHNMPQIGDSVKSRWRASLQVLPLVLANAWRPLDIYRLVELLSLPLAPVPSYASGRFLKAISKEPGVGGAAWKEALTEIAARYQEKEQKKGKSISEQEAATFAADLDIFLAGDRFDPEKGIPEQKLKLLCQRVIEWLAWRVDADPMLGEVVSHAREMQNLAEGKGVIPRVAVERMLDSVIGVGASAPDRFEQAALWQVVNHPGQITEPRKTIIWWGFIDPQTKPATYWSESERRNLQQFGAELVDSRTWRSREANEWRRGFGYAQEHMLMFYPERMHGETVYHHPFWDEIRSAAIKVHPEYREDEVASRLTREGAQLSKKGLWQLAGRTARLQKAERLERLAPAATHAIPKDVVTSPRELSYSQMSTMIGCPMKWALQFHADLGAPAAQSIPSKNQMIGSLCHRIVQELYREPGTHWAPQSAQARALDLYDSLVGSMAAELLMDGRELDNTRYREAIARAVRQLVEAIVRQGLVVEKSEERLEGAFSGEISLKGFVDLRLRDKQGSIFVLDLKWSTSSKYKKEEVEEGSALQLATYAWLLRSLDPARQVHAGYFMLAQGELLSDSGLLGDEAIDSLRSLEDIWEIGSQSWTWRVQEVRSGRLEARGVYERLLEAEKDLTREKLKQEMKREHQGQGLLYERPMCGFCDFTRLCGVGGEL